MDFKVRVWVKQNSFLVIALLIALVTLLVNKFSFRHTHADEYYQQQIQYNLQQQERQFEKIVLDTGLIQKLVQQQYTEAFLQQYMHENLGFGLFVYDISNDDHISLKFWNTQHMLPRPSMLTYPDEPEMIQLENGYFILLSRSITIASFTYKVIALLPVQWKYFVENANLQKSFNNIPRAIHYIDISVNPNDQPVVSAAGKTLFYVKKTAETGYYYPPLFLWGWLVAFMFFCLQIHQWSQRVFERKGLSYASLFLLIFVVMLRVLIYLFQDQLFLSQFELFNPVLYGSSLLLSSLGDLLLNVLMGVWMVMFIGRRIHYAGLKRYEQNWKNWLMFAFLLFCLVAYSFVIADIIQSLVADAKISFNVTNFFSLTIYSFIGFVILATLALGYFFSAQILLKLSIFYNPAPAFFTYFTVAFFGLLLLSLTRNSAMIELNLLVLLWLLVFIFIMKNPLSGAFTLQISSSQVLFWLFLFSCSMSVLVVFENRKIELEQRKRFAEKLAQQSDPSSERILSITLTYLDNNFLYPNFQRFHEPLINTYLKDSIINKSFSAYLNKYDTRIYTFDSSFQPLHNDDESSYDLLNTIYQIQGKKTLIPEMRYYEKAFDKYTYIFRREVVNPDNEAIGYFFVISDPKRYKADALVPELFKQSRELTPEYAPNYSYAVYSGGNLLTYFNDYAFPTSLDADQIPRDEFTFNTQARYDELWYKHGADRIVVIAVKSNTILETITLFAYLFSTFLLLLMGYRFLSTLVKERFHLGFMQRYFQLSIRTQIHSIIILVSLFSFLIIAIVTILFFINRYQRNNQDRLSRASQLMVTEVERQLPVFRGDDKEVEMFNPGFEQELESLIKEISETHGTDVNLYDTSGRLQVSSNPDIYQRGVLSDIMNPLPYYRLHTLRQVQTVADEKVGKVEYQSIYTPVRNDDGKAIAYLNTPSFSSQDELKQEISNFLVTIINLNAFVFIIAGVIAVFIANRITNSFSLIVDKMREVNLGGVNEEIEWSRNDEIGVLVKEYNTMVQKLAESAQALAKSEREGAWRQMARQVAHEIKNPLTPMKLSIQYLQKAIDSNSPNVKALTANVARTLVEQIDHLSKIASDFSQFANIGVPKKEQFDLHEVLHSLAHLYETNEQIDFSWNPVHQQLILFEDKTQINRLFTNLLQNAVDAVSDQPRKVIAVNELIVGNRVVISITDSGGGIPENMRNKIFTPNFTTKTSGTGLGLAMCKSIIEQARGDIWFETIEGSGTTFFVQFPLEGQS